MRKLWILVAVLVVSPSAWGHGAVGDTVLVPKGALACPYRQDAESIVHKMATDWRMTGSTAYRHAYYAKMGCVVTPQAMRGKVTRRRDGIAKIVTGPGHTYLWTLTALVRAANR